MRVVQKQANHDQEDHESYEQVPIKMQFRVASFRRYTENDVHALHLMFDRGAGSCGAEQPLSRERKRLLKLRHVVMRTVSHRPACLATPFSTNRPLTGLRRRAYILNVDLKRDQLETRVATLELMLVTERAHPKPREDKIAKLEQELKAAKAALGKYNREYPR